VASAELLQAPAEVGRLASALDSVQAPNISADLHFIASDEMKGRDTPSPEQRIAARYIAARLARLGFTPAGRDGYLYPYELGQRSLDVARSVVTLASASPDGGEKRLVFGRDYFFSTPSAFEALEVPASAALFCGESSRDSLEGLSPAGKWVVAFAVGDKHRAFTKDVAELGAVGLVLIERPSSGEDPFPERYAKIVERAAGGSVHFIERREEKPEEREFPVLYLSRSAGLSLLELCAARGTAPAASWEPAPGSDLGVTIAESRVRGGNVVCENVCGLWPGSDPELADEVIIVSAHYDHVGMQGGVIHNGADDNGSGTCGMLALAEALKSYGPMRRSILLMWVSGEEKGLFGSRAWTLDPSLPEGTRAVCDLNIDMIGRNAPDYLLITPTKDHPAYNGLTKVAEANAAIEGFAPLGSADDYWSRSDHMNFSENLKIPVAFLFSDVHEDYHRPGDDPEKIDYDKIRRVVRLVLRMIDGLQGDELPS
jgi:hypothetical protein